MRFERTLLAAACLLVVWKAFAFPDELIASHDARDSWLPYIQMLRLDWTDPLHPPLWNPHIQCGTPRVGKFPALWYVTLTVGALPAAIGMNLWIAVHLLAGVFGMRYWARAAGVNAPIAALCYAMSSVWPARVYAGHLAILVALAFGPWALGAIERLAARPGPGPAAAFAAAAGVMLLFGHPMYMLPLAAIGAVIVLTSASRRLFGWLFVGTAVAFALAAATLLPSAEFMPHTQRMASENVWEMIPIWIHVEDLMPMLVSHPGDPAALGWEKSASIGACGTMLFVTGVVATRRDRRTWAFLALIASTLLLSMGPATPLFSVAAPALEHLRAIPRFMVVFVWIAPILAARGLAATESRRDGIAIAAILVAVAVCIEGLTVPAVTAIGATALAAAALRRPVLIAGIMAAEGALAAALWIQPGPPHEPYAYDPPRDGRLYDATAERENVPAVQGIDVVRGYDPLPLNAFARLYYATWTNWDTPPSEFVTFWVRTTTRRHLFDLMNARYVVTTETLEGDGFTRLGTNLYRNERALPRAFGVSNAVPGTVFTDADPRTTVVLPAGFPEVARADAPRVEIVARAPGRYRLRTDGAGYVVVAESWAPGWRATVDGAPVDILPAWEAFMCVPIEAGAHDVELVYSPKRFWIGFWISLAAWAGLAAWLTVQARRRTIST